MVIWPLQGQMSHPDPLSSTCCLPPPPQCTFFTLLCATLSTFLSVIQFHNDPTFTFCKSFFFFKLSDIFMLGTLWFCCVEEKNRSVELTVAMVV